MTVMIFGSNSLHTLHRKDLSAVRFGTTGRDSWESSWGCSLPTEPTPERSAAAAPAQRLGWNSSCYGQPQICLGM